MFKRWMRESVRATAATRPRPHWSGERFPRSGQRQGPPVPTDDSKGLAATEKTARWLLELCGRSHESRDASRPGNSGWPTGSLTSRFGVITRQPAGVGVACGPTASVWSRAFTMACVVAALWPWRSSQPGRISHAGRRCAQGRALLREPAVRMCARQPDPQCSAPWLYHIYPIAAALKVEALRSDLSGVHRFGVAYRWAASCRCCISWPVSPGVFWLPAGPSAHRPRLWRPGCGYLTLAGCLRSDHAHRHRRYVLHAARPVAYAEDSGEASPSRLVLADWRWVWP